MNTLKPIFKIFTLALGLWFAHAASAQTPIAITNASFEDSASGTPDGWTNVNGGGDVYEPTTAQYDPLTKIPDGTRVATVYQGTAGDGLSQVLAATFQEGLSYTLTVKVGDPADEPFDGYIVQLLADGTVLEQDDNTQASVNGDFVTSTVSYSYDPGDAALVGQPLEIRLLSKGLNNGDVNFDDVQLTIALSEPAANAGGPYTVPIGGFLTLDGGGSLPSEGETITTWEWDLRNDETFDVTGETPTDISYADLQNVYGMDTGPNTIQLRVTDSAAKTSTVEGIVNLAAPIGCQLGVLDLTANGGINPNTGNPWELGDTYRIAFHTLGTTQTISNDPEYYNSFATSQAWEVPALQGAYWRAMVTVNLDPTTTQELSPKRHVQDNTGTGDLTGGAGVGGAGEPVYVVDGTTCIARNNADIWNAWSNPFDGNAVIRVAPPISSQNVHYSPFLDQNGNQTVTPDNVHGKDVATGCNSAGGHVNALGNTTDFTSINRGNTNANNTGRIWVRFTDATTTPRSLYVISVPLTIVNLADTEAPTLVSIVDDREGADINANVEPVVYTVTFSEAIDAATVTVDDFENLGTAGITIDSIRGTLSASAFDVVVTPTSSGTLQLQVKADAVIEDALGNPMDTTSPIADDTIIQVLDDTTPPTLVSIEDNVDGASVIAFNSITYTVTFDEPIDASTVDIADFGNGGSAPVTIDSVSITGDPAVFTVVVTPTGAGDLTLEIVEGATITDLVGNPLDTTSALPDDTTITVEPDPVPTLVSIVDNQSGGSVFETQSFTYFVTFDQVIDAPTVDVTDFENGTGPAITVNAVAATGDPSVFAVHVTPGGVGTITLQIAAGAVITNTNGTPVDTTSVIPDDTTITVNAGSGPARGTIIVDNVAFWSANSSTLSGTLDASGSDKLVVIVTGENGNPGSHAGTSTAVTYDGVSLTKVVERNPIPGPSGTTADQDQTYNDIWILDNPGAVHTAGEISATVSSRGSVTAFALSGTAPGVGQTAISPQASKSVVLSTGFANSIVIASHGMGGDGNTANVGAVDAVSPLVQASATAQASGSPSPWDGHVTATTDGTAIPAGTATYAFTGGNLVGSHTIAAEFLAAEVGTGSPYGTWADTNAPGQNPDEDFDGDGVPNAIEFVLGGDKDTNDLGKLPTVATSGGDMTFTFVRDQVSVDGSVSVVIEVSTDLVDWTDVFTVGADTASSTPGVTVTDNEDGTDTITLSVAQAPDDKKFARLKVVIINTD